MQRKIATLGMTTLAACGLAACSSSDGPGGASGPETGTLSIGLIDTPVFDAEEVWICITQVNVKPDEGPAEPFPIDDADPENSCDGERFELLSLRDPAEAAMLVDGEEMAVGHYEWIELELDAARPGQSGDADGDLDSYVMDSEGGQHILRVPSGSVRLVNGFTITAGEHMRFTLDWDLRSGLTNPQGQEGYFVRPALRIIDENTFGTLNGTVTNNLVMNAQTSGETPEPLCTVDDSDFDVGNVVYLFAGTEGEAPPEPDDNDDVAPDAYATIEVTPNSDDSDYGFETLVAPGEYRIAFTCQGDNDLPDRNENDPENPDDEIEDVVFMDPDGDAVITIVEGETTTVNFSLSAE